MAAELNNTASMKFNTVPPHLIDSNTTSDEGSFTKRFKIDSPSLENSPESKNRIDTSVSSTFAQFSSPASNFLREKEPQLANETETMESSPPIDQDSDIPPPLKVSSTMATAEISQDKNFLALLKTNRFKIKEQFGVDFPGGFTYLYPEESLYLLESGKLEVKLNGIELSVERSRGLFLHSPSKNPNYFSDSSVREDLYSVYKHFSKFGYHLRRSPHNLNQNNANDKNPSNSSPKSENKTNENVPQESSLMEIDPNNIEHNELNKNNESESLETNSEMSVTSNDFKMNETKKESDSLVMMNDDEKMSNSFKILEEIGTKVEPTPVFTLNSEDEDDEDDDKMNKMDESESSEVIFEKVSKIVPKDEKNIEEILKRRGKKRKAAGSKFFIFDTEVTVMGEEDEADTLSLSSSGSSVLSIEEVDVCEVEVYSGDSSGCEFLESVPMSASSVIFTELSLTDDEFSQHETMSSTTTTTTTTTTTNVKLSSPVAGTSKNINIVVEEEKVVSYIVEEADDSDVEFVDEIIHSHSLVSIQELFIGDRGELSTSAKIRQKGSKPKPSPGVDVNNAKKEQMTVDLVSSDEDEKTDEELFSFSEIWTKCFPNSEFTLNFPPKDLLPPNIGEREYERNIFNLKRAEEEELEKSVLNLHLNTSTCFESGENCSSWSEYRELIKKRGDGIFSTSLLAQSSTGLDNWSNNSENSSKLNSSIVKNGDIKNYNFPYDIYPPSSAYSKHRGGDGCKPIYHLAIVRKDETFPELSPFETGDDGVPILVSIVGDEAEILQLICNTAPIPTLSI